MRQKSISNSQALHEFNKKKTKLSVSIVQYVQLFIGYLLLRLWAALFEEKVE